MSTTFVTIRSCPLFWLTSVEENNTQNSPWPCLLLKLTSAEENHIEGPGGVHVVQNEQCHLLGAQQCRPLHGIGHVQQDDDLCCCIGTHFKLGVKGQHARLEKRHAKSSHNDSRPLTKKTLEVCHSAFPPAHPSRTACWQTHHQNIASLSPDRSSQRMFFPRVNFVCWLSFGIHSNPVLPQRQVKDPSHLPKVQAAGYTWTSIHPWPNQVRVGWLCCPGIVWEPIWENEPTCNSSGNTQPPSSQLAEPLWTDSGLKKVELVCTSWSASKIFLKKLRQGMNCQNHPTKSLQAWKKLPPTLTHMIVRYFWEMFLHPHEQQEDTCLTTTTHSPHHSPYGPACKGLPPIAHTAWRSLPLHPTTTPNH